MLHNRYQFAGGEDASTEAEVALLRQAGHDVALMEAHNDRLKTLSGWAMVQLFQQTVWNAQAYHQVRDRLQVTHADLLHVQNFFPMFSPAVHAAAHNLNIPTIQHLRNFRLACLNAYLLRDGQVCEACLGKNPWRGLLYQCYRRSFPASFGVWSMITAHRWRRTWQRDVDAFITPSHFAAEKLVQAGIPDDRLHIKPDFIPDPLPDHSIPPQPLAPRFVFVGRLNEQKGVTLLLEAWRQLQQKDWELILIGIGEQSTQLQQFVTEYALSNVKFLGQLPLAQVLQVLQTATAVVVPSQSYETFGRVAIEAFANGRPALVSALGALPELVQEGSTGLIIPHRDLAGWVDRLYWAGHHPTEMGKMGHAARQRYLAAYTPAANNQQLQHIYQQVLA